MSVDRIKLLMQSEGIGVDEVAARTSISYNRWANVLSEKVKLRHEEIEALGKAFPQYRFWLSFGEQLPECGQIKPGTDSQ